MPCRTADFFNLSRWLGPFHCSTNINVDCVKLINLLLFEGIKANSLALADLSKSLPRTRVGKHWFRSKSLV